MRQKAVLFIIVLLILSNISYSETPKTLSYQGKLTDSSGDPVVDSTYSVKFDIYTDPISESVYLSLWTETLNVTTVDGLFSVVLGQTNPIPDSAYNWPERFLVINLDGQDMSPATKLTSVPYASQAQNSENLNNQAPGFYTDWNNLNNVPSGFADGVDNEGGSSVGLAAKHQFLTTTLVVDSMRDISTVTITIPDSGYIYVTGRCTIGFSGTVQNNIAYLQIDETSGGFQNGDDVAVGLYGYVNAIEGYMPVFVDKVFHKTSAGTYTFRLEGLGGSTDPSGVVKAYYQGVTAMYLPVAMGSVD